MGGSLEVRRVGLATVGAVAFAALIPGQAVSAVSGGRVVASHSGDTITLTATDYSDNVYGYWYDGHHFEFRANHDGVTAGPGCEQITDGHVKCPRSSTIVFLGNGGNDRFEPVGFTATQQIGGPGRDKLIGGDEDDELVGSRGADILYGNSDDDTLRGGKGPDKLRGYNGRDALEGGPGVDDCDGGVGRNTISGCEGL